MFWKVFGALAIILCRDLINQKENKECENLSILPILKRYEVILALVSVLSATCTIGFVETLLELYLKRTFSSSVSTVGLCFLGLTSAFTIVTFVSGYCVDKHLQPITVTTIGLTLLAISFTFFGHLSWFLLKPRLEVTITCLLLQGAGAACVILSTFNSCLQATLKIEGYSESLATTSIVSGIWTSGYSLGNFLGSTLGGIFYEKVNRQHLSLCYF